MTVNVTLDNDLKRYTLEIVGAYNLEDMKLVFSELLAQPVENDVFCYDQLVIHRRSEFLGTERDIVEIAEFRSGYETEPNSRRVAIVYLDLELSAKASVEVFMEAKKLSTIESRNIKYFDKVEHAHAWLDSKLT